MKVGPVQTKKTPTIASVRKAGLNVTDITLRFFLVASLPELRLRYIFETLDIRHSLKCKDNLFEYNFVSSVDSGVES